MSATKTFMEALSDRYGAEDEDEATYDFCITGNKGSANMKKWEMVGLEKARQVQSYHSKLRVLSLENAGITAALKQQRQQSTDETNSSTATAVSHEIAEAQLHRVVELNLSGENNIIPLVPDVDTIVQALPRLQELNLSRMASLFSRENENAARQVRVSWKYLSTLTLNATGISWTQAVTCLDCPKLQKLSLADNSITTLCITQQNQTPPAFPELVELDLSGNDIHDSWVELVAGRGGEDGQAEANDSANADVGIGLVGTAPKLERLTLNANRHIQNLPFHSAALASTSAHVITKTITFIRQLKHLALFDCAGVDSIQALYYCIGDSLPSLRIEYTKLFRCPIDHRPNDAASAAHRCGPRSADMMTGQRNDGNAVSEVQARMLTIASLPSLKTLNNAAVRDKERHDSELYYLQLGLLTAVSAPSEEEESSNSSSEASPQQPQPQPQHNDVFPRLEELKLKHPSAVEALLSSLDVGHEAGSSRSSNDGSMASLLIDVTLRCVKKTRKNDNLVVSTVAEAKKSVSLTMTIARLQSLCLSIPSFKAALGSASVEAAQYKFWPADATVFSDDGATVLNDQQKTIGFYGLTRGAIVTLEIDA